MVWPGSRGKDQIVPLLFSSWKTFKHLSGSGPPSAKPGYLMCPGVPVERTAQGVHAALTKTDRISCSPQEGELRTLT